MIYRIHVNPEGSDFHADVYGLNEDGSLKQVFLSSDEDKVLWTDIVTASEHITKKEVSRGWIYFDQDEKFLALQFEEESNDEIDKVCERTKYEDSKIAVAAEALKEFLKAK